MNSRLVTLKEKRLQEITENTGRGGCGIIAVAELSADPSHKLVKLALDGLVRLEHRGGTLGTTGDGAGLLLKPEKSFFEKFIKRGKQLSSKKEPLIIGSIFFLHGERNIPQYQKEINSVLRQQGLSPLGWRKTPINLSALGRRAAEDVPTIYQFLLAKGHRREAQLFEVMHNTKGIIEERFPGILNVVSLSRDTLVYKALATSKQLIDFYPDLNDLNFKSSVVIGHRRFSTNTYSNWNLIQPFRHIAHNGEINTITANCRAVNDAENSVNRNNTLMNHGSDSAQIDRVAEMMTANGMSGIHEALRRMMPPVWSENNCSDKERRFYEANRRALGTLGAWEGPIAIVATDGNYLTATLDRMGLRPLRYIRTKENMLVISSEIGVVPVEPSDVMEDGQLEPGGMIIADLKTGQFLNEQKATEWIISQTGLNFDYLSTVGLQSISQNDSEESVMSIGTLNSFGWTKERISQLKGIAKSGKEPVHSMGNDRPLAIFSENHSRLYSFLHQIVAVVTNPPIDPIREGGAIDTTTYLGRSPLLSRQSTYGSREQYEIDHPILLNQDIKKLLNTKGDHILTKKIDATFVDNGNAREIIRRIQDLTDEAIELVIAQKISILIISDIEATRSKRLPLPMLLVISVVHRALAAKGYRRNVSIILETGEVQEGHDFATLLAYGATAVNPYAMFHIANEMKLGERDKIEANIVKALLDTLKRIMSKMGITMISGYRGSALFEAVGLSADIVEYFLPDTICRLGGLRIDDVYDDIVARSKSDSEKLGKNKNVAVYRKEVTDALQMVARNGNEQGDYDRFVNLLEDTPPVYLRDLLSFRFSNNNMPLDNVDHEKEIIKTTFRGAAMSHGALNATAHQAIAAAFNHFDSYSNCGEGGEDEQRNPGGKFESDRSRIRQIASGRFGVDAQYIIGADEIEIKIGQGAKPGEGGHLPGHKVTAEIARIRKTREGTDLISPPPHHDIYSIEDLSQLILHMRELHPKAIISVKVPSISNLGTIAVGIVKTGANVIVVSGFEGGTGAASSSSITHAGLPVERGVSEVHQYLVANGIRKEIRIRADGGIKSGLDIAKIIALGADEISIGTPLLIAECCIFCRGCNKGNCPVGIATQDEKKLSSRFMKRRLSDVPSDISPEQARYEEAKNGVIRYLESQANHLRRILARLGLTSPSELVGRVDLLSQQETGNHRWDQLDLSELLLDFRENTRSTPGNFHDKLHIVSKMNHLIADKIKTESNNGNNQISIPMTVKNTDHAIGATLAGNIANKTRENPDTKFEILATGYAGQGFGFGATDNMTFKLSGYANDAVGEVMSGSACIVITPDEMSGNQNPLNLIGNAAAYGAKGGTLYVAGFAGQRFGVRNSGATLVCEGFGKYGFEYMTGGLGIVLGEIGACMGSGMTGGEIFLYKDDDFVANYIHKDVQAHQITDEAVYQRLFDQLKDYYKITKSPKASAILDNWQISRNSFLHITTNTDQRSG